MASGLQSPGTSSSSEYDEGLSLLDLLVAVAKSKRLVIGLPALASAIALIVTFLVPEWYVATAKLLPPQQAQSSAAAILGPLSGLAGGAGQALGLKNPNDTYVAMLRSRTIADKLIRRFDLQKVYGEDLLAKARKELAENTIISSGRDGIIIIEVEDKNPQRAADLTNAYVEGLRDLTLHLAVTEAGQRRLFFENQLKKAKTDLANAEIEFTKFTQDVGLVMPEGQLSLSVSTAAALRAQIAAKEIHLSTMRTFATDSNPELRRSLQELSGLRAELAKMEKNSDSRIGDVLVPFGKAPEVGLEYIRRYREMKYFETLFELLAKQYEVARIDEAKDPGLVQVLDAALPPERKSKPNRLGIAAIVAAVAFVLAVVVALLRTWLERALRTPQLATRLEELRSLTFGSRKS